MRRGWVRCAIWLASLVLVCAWAGWRMDAGGPIQSNILGLLPQDHAGDAVGKAVARSREAFGQEMLVVISGPDTAATRKGAQAARRALRAAGLAAHAAVESMDKALSLYRAHPFALLTPAQQARLESGGTRALATDIAVSLASPAGMVDLAHDPGGYLQHFLATLPRPYPRFLPDGKMLSSVRGGRRLFLLRLHLPASAFGGAGPERAVTGLADARRALSRACGDCRLEATGAALFAQAARQSGQRETLWLGGTSTLLIMLLIAYVFRSLAPHLLGFLQLFASVAAAGAAVIGVFGSINILTLVFGTTLLGIAIDYAFLYFSEYWFGSSPPPAVMGKIRSGLVVGLITGTLAFAFLLLAGFPALAQIAVFSIAGLLEAALVVWLVFPVALHRPPRVAVHPTVRWPQHFVAAACRPSRWRWILPLVALAAAVPGWLMLQAHDDVRELTHFPPHLVQADQAVRRTLGRYPASGFLLTQAGDLATALEREDRLFARITRTLPQATPIGLAGFVPPPDRQQASLATWQHLLEDPNRLRDSLTRLGLPAGLAGTIEKAWQTAPHQTLDAKALVHAVPALERFLVPTDHGVALIATVFADHDPDPAALAAAARASPGSQYVRSLERIDHTFSRLRVRATGLVVIGYLLICVILIARYGWREALRMLYPPLVALGVTLGVLGWLGEPLNVFSVVALILILGLGRDYAIFLREIGGTERSAALAITLSALTTLCSFGLLALSATPALHAFGITTLVGIAASFLVAPLSLEPRARESE